MVLVQVGTKLKYWLRQQLQYILVVNTHYLLYHSHTHLATNYTNSLPPSVIHSLTHSPTLSLSPSPSPSPTIQRTSLEELTQVWFFMVSVSPFSPSSWLRSVTHTSICMVSGFCGPSLPPSLPYSTPHSFLFSIFISPFPSPSPTVCV